MLVFFAGKMGSGKTTASSKLADELEGVLISEDEWLSQLFPNEIETFDDFIRCSSRLKPLIFSHVKRLLRLNVTVVMDFPANTKNQRKWFKAILENSDYPHRLIYLEASDELCIQRVLQRRSEQPDRQAFDNEQVFRHVTRYFEPPEYSEGFNVEILKQDTGE